MTADGYTLDEIEAAIGLADQYRHFRSFARAYWMVAQPGRRPVWGWHLDYVCDRIQAHLQRGWGTLVCCMPVRGGKSTLFNVLAQAWDWLHRPNAQWANIAKSDKNASRDSRKTRKVITSAQYQTLARLAGVAAALQLERDQNQKESFVNAAGGGRQAVTTGGAITGADVDRLVINDAMDAREVEIATPVQALARCAEVVTRFDDVWTDRFTPNPDVLDHEPGVRLIVAQRLHDRDLNGILMARKRAGAVDIEVIVIPEVMDRSHPDAEFFAPCDRRVNGEFLNPRLRGMAFREAVLARPGGARKWATRYDQRPTPREGGIIKREWYSDRYTAQPEVMARTCAELWICIDPAGIEEVTGQDYTVMGVWGRIGEYALKLDEARGQWGITRQKVELQALIKRWPRATMRYVEKTVNGLALLKWAQASGVSLIGVPTRGADKRERAQDFVAMSEERRVRLPPDDALWPSSGVVVRDTVDEWCGFLAGAANDDRLDEAAYAGMHMARRAAGSLAATDLDAAF